MEKDKLSFINELGMGLEDATPLVDAETKPTEDFVQDSTTEESGDNTNGNTEPDISVELRKQIEGLEKRISDKDEYINTLREQSKKQEADESMETGDTQDNDFWDDPEKIVKDMQETIRIQQMQIQETVYANTVNDYWKTVNPEALKTAVATDPEFQKEFNSSSEPYRTAYEYLSKKTEAKKTEEQTLREQIKAELLKEMGVKDKPKGSNMPNMGGLGGSNGSKTDAPDDGFSAVFGKQY